MQEFESDCVLEARAMLGEGACWFAAEQKLYWVDILRCEVHRFDPAAGTDEVRKTPCQVSLVQPTTRGDLVLATRDGIARMNFATGRFTILCDPEANIPGNRFNDGKPDPRGRLFAGTIACDGSDKKAALWRIEPDLSFTKLVDHVGNSNGLGWSPDEKTFYWTDTKTGCVFAFDYDVATGDIANRRVVVEVDKALGRPDGLTVDAEGFLWTALWAGHGVARWNPANGQMVAKVECPSVNVTCPAFGGADLDILYFSTAQKGRDDAEPSPEPEAGNLFAAKVGVRGLPGFSFAG
ncbi:MAG: SMP-30/gluconolactonase/LRE family protein [Chthoniobacterales bacterium]|nr:SMP-30/gluconolactonase/LRE family protein [Chthoniobacterales bacterium]